jgi:hypothetical protein
LSDSAENPRFIETLPRKGYRFIAPVTETTATVKSATSTQIPRPPHWRLLWAFAFGLIALIAAVSGWMLSIRTPRTISATPLPLTTYAGQESRASFSPDGNQVAFVWDGETQNNFDIYVKLIGSETLLRITSNSASDFSPA